MKFMLQCYKKKFGGRNMKNVHNTYSFPSHTGTTDIFVQSVSPAAPSEIRGVIQLSHGMAEHTDRYLEIADYFADHGYVFIMHDHAGHGRSVKDDSMNGYFCEKDGYKRLVEDVKEVTEIAKKNWPGVKIILWGHSMGSFIARNYIATFAGSVNGAVICGTSGKNPAAPAGIFIANLVAKTKGAKYKSKFIDNIAFGSYNKKFTGNTGFEWLSVNEENVKKYVADPKCGFMFSASAFRDLFSVLNSVSGDKWYNDVPKKMPVYLIAGTDDPVGNYGKGVKEVYDKLIATGHENVTMKLYDGLRHEIHNEDARFEVCDDILKFAETIV